MSDIMDLGITFVITSILLGVGLAMDAFSVSVANGLNEPDMKRSKVAAISGTFAVFQGLMPLIGWFIVVTAVGALEVLDDFIPWIALIILTFIGGKMIKDGLGDEGPEPVTLGFAALMAQGIATSIDALSVGFTISDYDVLGAVICALIIALVTWIICAGGLVAGKRLGSRFTNRATIFGGAILILIGLEIFITGVFL